MSSSPPDVTDLGVFGDPLVASDEELREKLIDQITEMRSVIEAINGDWLNNHYPNEKQWEAINCYERFLYLSGGNQIGKSWMLRFWAGWALSGMYPPEWTGPKKMGDLHACFGSLNNERLYSNVSRWLFGPSQAELGQGFIPAKCLDPSNIRWDKKNNDLVRRAKIHRFDHHGHHMGFSHYQSWAYTEQFPHGDSFDLFGLDEEFSDQQGYYPSIIARLKARKGYMKAAVTPEHGVTEMYRHIKDKARHGSHDHKLLYYSVYDAEHIEDKEDWVKDFKGTSEYALRVFGKPIAGDNAAFELDFEEVMIPVTTRVGEHFKEIIGIDIPHVPQGIFAAVKIAYSEITNEVVVLDAIEIKDKDYSHHVARLRDLGGEIVPIAWPADSMNRVVHGRTFVEFMQSHGLHVLDQSAHEVVFNADNGKAIQVRDVWPICNDLQRLMIAGDLKIMRRRSTEDLIEQLRVFQFDENRKADKHQMDDVADAFFKAYMMRRFAASVTTVNVGGSDVIIDDGDWDVFA